MTKLKAGRRGLMRNGKVTGALKARGRDEDDFLYRYQYEDVVVGETWRKNGRWCSQLGKTDRDIIALIPKGWVVLDECVLPSNAKKVMLNNGKIEHVDNLSIGVNHQIAAYKPLKKPKKKLSVRTFKVTITEV